MIQCRLTVAGNKRKAKNFKEIGIRKGDFRFTEDLVAISHLISIQPAEMHDSGKLWKIVL